MNVFITPWQALSSLTKVEFPLCDRRWNSILTMPMYYPLKSRPNHVNKALVSSNFMGYNIIPNSCVYYVSVQPPSVSSTVLFLSWLKLRNMANHTYPIYFPVPAGEPPRPSPWQPDTAPGVNPTTSLTFLRPAGPPPGMVEQHPQQQQQQQPGTWVRSTASPFQALPPQPPTVESRDTPGWGLPFAEPQATPQHGQQQSSLPPRVIDNPSMMQEIAPYLDSGVDEDGRRVLIEAFCPICCRTLELPDHVTARRDPEPDIEPMVVTPCGHLLGSHCLEQHLRERDEQTYMYGRMGEAASPQMGGHGQGQRLEPGEMREGHPNYDTGYESDGSYEEEQWPSLRDCPMCRFPLTYPRCGCAVPLRAYSGRLGRAAQTPATLGEGGAVPRACRRHDRAAAARGVARLLADHLSDDVPAASYLQPATRGPEHVRGVCAWLNDVFLLAISWRVEGMMTW